MTKEHARHIQSISNNQQEIDQYMSNKTIDGDVEQLIYQSAKDNFNSVEIDTSQVNDLDIDDLISKGFDFIPMGLSMTDELMISWS